MKPDLGRRLKEQATEIAFPRAAGSEGNERARRIVRDRLVEARLQVEEQLFSYDLKRAFRAIRWTLRGAAVAVGVSATIAVNRPGVASLALVAAILGGAVLLAWAPGAEKLYAADGPTSTANVIGRRPASGRRRKTLVVLAHYDSKSQNLTFPWCMGATILAIAGTGGLSLFLLFRMLPVEIEVPTLVGYE